MEGRETIQFVPDVKQRKRRNPGQVAEEMAGVHKQVQGVLNSHGQCILIAGKLCSGNIVNNDVLYSFCYLNKEDL